MTIFKRFEVNLEAERRRIAKVAYTKKQRAALLKLVELFEKGEWQACLNHVNDKKAFPYNRVGEYDEKEHICEEISSVLHGVAYENYYTSAQLLEQAKKQL